MSTQEYNNMCNTGLVQESFTGTTHVADPANSQSFYRQAKNGSLYAEFNVPENSVKKTGEGWSKILGPKSAEGRLNARKGNPFPGMPPATIIERIRTKP
ncbi:hypothetical protein BK131_23630 [Paenibacillus amylolyticus]|uniref:TreTu toxin C-terminal domain-containing protein n=1 Tax=Paenibacillus amylolyticus TaxID=1451 RepID=A0A1R1BL95_PAEAM|nr:hypothetical protein [Paenibacillus amylolyticus]OMF10609.1 hypothetical protein BK131_23630 [Paenibacillus amylolyticus]